MDIVGGKRDETPWALFKEFKKPNMFTHQVSNGPFRGGVVGWGAFVQRRQLVERKDPYEARSHFSKKVVAPSPNK